MLICFNCDKENPDEALFCQECGNRIRVNVNNTFMLGNRTVTTKGTGFTLKFSSKNPQLMMGIAIQHKSSKPPYKIVRGEIGCFNPNKTSNYGIVLVTKGQYLKIPIFAKVQDSYGYEKFIKCPFCNNVITLKIGTGFMTNLKISGYDLSKHHKLFNVRLYTEEEEEIDTLIAVKNNIHNNEVRNNPVFGNKIGNDIDNLVNTKENDNSSEPVFDPEFESNYASDEFGSEEIFMMVWNADISNTEKQIEMKDYLVEQMKENPGVLSSWADGFLKSYNISKALLISEVATIVDPRNPKAWNIRGVSYAFSGNVQMSQFCFEKALVYDPLNKSAKKGFKEAKKGNTSWVYKEYNIPSKRIHNI